MHGEFLHEKVKSAARSSIFLELLPAECFVSAAVVIMRHGRIAILLVLFAVYLVLCGSPSKSDRGICFHDCNYFGGVFGSTSIRTQRSTGTRRIFVFGQSRALKIRNMGYKS